MLQRESLQGNAQAIQIKFFTAVEKDVSENHRFEKRAFSRVIVTILPQHSFYSDVDI